jgi:predicted MFS family arabinose efflux permease
MDHGPVMSARQLMMTSFRLALGTASALGLARFAYGLLVPAMRTELGWSLTAAGAMTTANGLGYLAGALVTATIAGRLSMAVAFRLGMIGTAVNLAATAISSDFVVLLAARAGAGLTGALVFITGGVMAARMAASGGSAAPLTVYFSGTGLGIALSGATIPPLLDQHPSRWPLAWVGLAAAAGLATAVSWTAAQSDGATVPTAAGRSRLRLLWRIAAAYVLFAAGYIAYITFLSAYLVDQHVASARIALTWTLLGLGVVAAPALWSRPIAVWPGARALTVLLLALATAALLPLTGAMASVLISAIAYGATFMGVPAAVTAIIRISTPSADWTPTLAAFTGLFAAGQTAGPWVAGALADRVGSGTTLVFTAVLCSIGAWLATTAGRVTAQPDPRRSG